MAFESVDDYLDHQPEAVRVVLEEIRRTIHAALPGSGEKISYQIPAATLDGKVVVYFAGWKEHVSVYPLPEGLDEELAPYKAGRGTAKFRLDRPVPYALIARMAELLAARSR